MERTYEYRFVRLGEYRGSALFGVHGDARDTYEEAIVQHAREGWRLVQLFAPGTAVFGAAKYSSRSSSGRRLSTLWSCRAMDPSREIPTATT